MATTKLHQSWVPAGQYFLTYVLISFVLGGLYSLFIVYILYPLHLPRIEVFKLLHSALSWLIQLVIIFVGSYLSAQIIKRRKGNINADKIAKLATVFYVIFGCLFLIRDFLVTDINGVPITRHHFQTIVTIIITAVIFYMLAKRLLQK